MARPYEFTSSGAALTAAMTLCGTTRKRFIVQEILNTQGYPRWVVVHPDGNPAIPYLEFSA
ncbi:hypothetical protein PsexTeo8_21150 [Pseudomonas extremaustralis]|nr:hypothetical protein [Pseudomonas extremaustralis]